MYRYRFPFERLNEEFENMFRLFNRDLGATSSFPRLNVWANDHEAIVSVELPGVEPEAIDLQVHENRLTLRGTKPVTAENDATWHRNERHAGEFSRSVILPFRVAADKTQAECRNGLLTVRLQREGAEKPRKIEVKAL